MKLRLHGSSIRLRLNRNEVADLAAKGRIADQVDFGAGAILTYVLEVSERTDVPRASRCRLSLFL